MKSGCTPWLRAETGRRLSGWRMPPERLNAVYSGTKSFMLSLSTALQTELANTGTCIEAVLPGATRTELWGKAGVDVAAMRADGLMDVDEMVDAALAGLGMGEA